MPNLNRKMLSPITPRTSWLTILKQHWVTVCRQQNQSIQRLI